MPSNHQGLLQRALFQAAKAGSFELVREFIRAGANPFLHDQEERNAVSYAIAADPAEAKILLTEIFETNASKYTHSGARE